jgi:DNA-binding SARP family transcriptional activator
VLGRFAIELDGGEVISTGAERLIAFLALHDGLQARPYVAGMLWPDLPQKRALANVRTHLWRISTVFGQGVVAAHTNSLGLDPTVCLDLHVCRSYASAIRSGRLVPHEAVDVLGAELLPACYEDWCQPARERHRQLRLHALEDLCRRASKAGRFGLAVQAGLTAVACDPLRASAHRAVIAAYLAEGNVADARRQAADYATELTSAGLPVADANELCEFVR